MRGGKRVMLIREPVFIRKVKKHGYEVTGKLEGYGMIRKYGTSEEEAKDKFFQACNKRLHRDLPVA